MTTDPKTALIILMTNKSRLWVFKKAGAHIAKLLGLTIGDEKFIDTSWLETSQKGKELLTEAIEMNKQNFRSLIIIKDEKWLPSAAQIRNMLKQNKVYVSEIDSLTSEKFTEMMDAQGLVEFIIKNALTD